MFNKDSQTKIISSKKAWQALVGQQSAQGFTLIELMISIAIVVIVTGTVLTVARMSDTNKNLTLSAGELKATIREAQTNALVGGSGNIEKHICGYGVEVISDAIKKDEYQIFYTYAEDSEFDNNPRICDESEGQDSFPGIVKEALAESRLKLKDGVVFSEDSAEAKVFFLGPYGEASSTGFTLEREGGGGSVTININEFGKVD